MQGQIHHLLGYVFPKQPVGDFVSPGSFLGVTGCTLCTMLFASLVYAFHYAVILPLCPSACNWTLSVL